MLVIFVCNYAAGLHVTTATWPCIYLFKSFFLLIAQQRSCHFPSSLATDTVLQYPVARLPKNFLQESAEV